VCDLETSRIGAPYIYDIRSLKVVVCIIALYFLFIFLALSIYFFLVVNYFVLPGPFGVRTNDCVLSSPLLFTSVKFNSASLSLSLKAKFMLIPVKPAVDNTEFWGEEFRLYPERRSCPI
jgi:hypothetical protein